MDIVLRCAAIAEAWDDPTPEGRTFRQTDSGILLTWHDFARFLVRDGSEVTVEIAPGNRDMSIVRHLILGPVCGVLNYQRGLAIFHASAVALAEGGVAFMGDKGFGKSTQAAAFTQRGGTLITDDLLALRPEGRQLWAMPGVPFLKLWPESVAMLGQDPQSLPQVKDNLEKRALNMGDAVIQSPVPLRAIVLLGHGTEVSLERLPPRSAFLRLLPNWYGAIWGGEFLKILGLERQFRDCAAAVDILPVYLLRRPVDMDRIPSICQAIECII